MIPLFALAYGTVFVAEIIGDKLVYTTGVLASRYRTLPIMLGMVIAFMAKMALAVVVGKAISALPVPLVAGITAISFLGVAYALWRKSSRRDESNHHHRASKVAMISFAAIFFSEWGDAGQITAATLAARYGFPMVIWMGAVSALVTKGTLAAFLGAGVRAWIQERISPNTVRYLRVGLLVVLGAFSVLEILLRAP